MHYVPLWKDKAANNLYKQRPSYPDYEHRYNSALLDVSEQHGNNW